MPAYVLIGYRRGDARSLEGALKYFLLSLLTSLVMLYGFSFVYGLTGTTLYSGFGLLGRSGTLGLLAAPLALVGLVAKLSAAPFHYWAPDAYAGASPWIVAFVSTVPKIAGAVATRPAARRAGQGGARARAHGRGPRPALDGARQPRRAHPDGHPPPDGVLRRRPHRLPALGVRRPHGRRVQPSVFYAVAYAIPSMGVMLVAAEEGPDIESWAGLSSRRAPTAWAVVIILVSLIGIPPLVGFFGKLYLFSSAVSGGYAWLAIVAVVMSVVSAGYYLRIVRAMFFAPEPVQVVPVMRSYAAAAAPAILVAATIGLGLAAGPVLAWLGVFA